MARVALSSLRPDGKRVAIHPADVKGRFARARTIVFVALVAVYVALPWIQLGGHPAVFIDLGARRFFLFGATFNAQDVPMMVVILLGIGVGLIFVTALLGRVWCGWGCPQTVFLELLYRRVERWIMGPGEKRTRRAAGEWTLDRLWRTAVVQAIYAVFSLALAHVFLAYFVSLPRLWDMMRHTPAAHPEAFGVVAAVAIALHANFAWFREQICVVVCPYGRLQSVLIDPDSLIVGYDARRGEPRGKATRADAGDCVDCGRCVAVCPTGIDIRNGLQMDCIACTACIDACDDIMDRLHRPRGLIRYDSQKGLRGEKKKILRPRTFAYAGVLGVGLLIASLALGRRSDHEANLLRAVGMPFVLDGETVRNSFTVHLVNKRSAAAELVLEADGGPGATVTLPIPRVRLESLEDRDLPVIVSVPRGGGVRGQELHVRVRIDGEPPKRELRAKILGPVAP